jgi:hypothetical protein
MFNLINNEACSQDARLEHVNPHHHYSASEIKYLSPWIRINELRTEPSSAFVVCVIIVQAVMSTDALLCYSYRGVCMV